MSSGRIIPTLWRCRQAFLGSKAATAAILDRSFVSSSRPALEKHTIKVPTMGDSITEGTIVEWTASVGQAVKADDVVAMVETDKVTVEIKAEMDGVIMQHFGAVDDTVEVGADLYELDTAAEATVAAPVSTADPGLADPVVAEPSVMIPVAAETQSDKKQPTSRRTPSIQFIGKLGWELRRRGVDARAPTVFVIPPNYGRPAFSEEEIEALLTGGASLSPEVKQHSSGAVFGF